MASNVTAESLLETISTGHLECSICSCRFKQPKLLDCLHSFCLQCLQGLIQHQTPSNRTCTKLTCPLCRCKTTLSRSGVNDLSNDFRLSALIQEITLQEKILKGQETVIKCQGCDEHNQAISRCMDCEHFLCRECHKAHERMTVMKSHKIYTMAQFQSGEIKYRSELRSEIPKCNKHPNESLKIYCETCRQLVCTDCLVLQHGKHSIVDLPEAVKQSKKRIEGALAKAENIKAQFNTTIQETDTMRTKMDAAFTDTREKISKRAEKQVAKIRAEEEQLMGVTEKIYKEKASKFEAAQASNSHDMIKSQQKLVEVKQLVTEATSYEILELENKILHNLTELAKPQKVPVGLFFMDLRATDNNVLIGKIFT